MSRILPLLLVMLWPLLLHGGDDGEPKSWWEQRRQRPDIRYPHKIHEPVMQAEGDSCLMCHPFGGTRETDIDRLKALSPIANEPLEAICHDCHVDRLAAPSRCDVCHRDMSAIWPEDHDIDYRNRHAAAALRDAESCRQCHVDPSFCADCHFRRDWDPLQHPPGYLAAHGLDARLDALSCASCHMTRFCADCHREGER